MAQNNAADDEQTVTVNSHRTGLTDVEVGDHVVFGADADRGPEEWVYEGIKEQGDDPFMQFRRLDDGRSHSGERDLWYASQLEEALSSNGARVERDREVVA